jgi:hypothetical protein
LIATIVSGGDTNLRDYSGKKPRQYQISQDTSVSADTFRSKSRLKSSPSAPMAQANTSSVHTLLKRYTSFRHSLVPQTRGSTIPRRGKSSRPISAHVLPI